MNNILKQFAAWGMSLKYNEFERAAVRLTFSYVFGVFVILLISSAAIFLLFDPTFGSLSVEDNSVGLESGFLFEEFSFHEFGEHLIDVLLIVNISILVVATAFAYLLARRTLRPIEIIYRQQERFVGDVAHELRTPLAVLKAGSESILLRDHSSREYITFIKELEEETDRLTRLSNELLFLLKHKTIRVESFVMVDLTALLKKQVSNFQPYALQNHVTLVLEVGPTPKVLGLPDSLIRVCQNLIKNAIDYNKHDGLVSVTLTEEGDNVFLVVKDTGIGIAMAEQENIFNRFYKVDTSRTQSQAGTGLGLAIVQDIVKAHGGSIKIQSIFGEGTSIIVRLPKVISSS